MDLSQARRLDALIARVTNHLGFVGVYSLLRRRVTRSQVAILTYHRVGDLNEAPWNVPLVKAQDFEKQMRYLCKTYTILPLDTLVRYIQQGDCLPKKAVVITFDDGYKNNFKYAYPILKKYNIPATINLATAHIGTGGLFWYDKVKFALWNTEYKVINLNELGTYHVQSNNARLRVASKINERLKKLPEAEKNRVIEKIVNISGVDIPANLGREIILSWDDIMEMNKNGITFGAHSLTHPNLAKLSTEQARYEIAYSKRSIEERLGREVTVFCYPNGDFNTEIIKLVNEAGFYCALTVIPRMVEPKASLYELGRISGGWNLDTLKLFSCGAYSDLNTMLCRIRGRS